MGKTIYILNENKSLAETLVWTLQLGTELKAISITDPSQLKQAGLFPDLILAEPGLYERVSAMVNTNTTPVLLIASNLEDDQVIEALYAGANDVADLSKGPEEIIEKVNQLLFYQGQKNNPLLKRLIGENKGKPRTEADKNEYGLTAKEKEILSMMKEGSHLKLIAQLTNSSYETVRTHVKHIYKKLGVMSASEAVIKAMKMGM